MRCACWEGLQLAAVTDAERFELGEVADTIWEREQRLADRYVELPKIPQLTDFFRE